MRWGYCQASASSRCSLRSRSLCLPWFCNQRIRMECRPRRFLQHSVGVNRPGAFRPGSDHASILPSVCYCRGSSHRTRSVGHGSCRGGFLSLSPASPPTHPMNFSLCIVVPLRVYRSLRCAPFRVYIMKIIRRLPAALGGESRQDFPCGSRLCRLSQAD